MNTHKNALLTPKGRLVLVTRALLPGVSRRQVATEFRTTSKTVSKWVERYRVLGADGLEDLSSRPRSSHPRAITRQTRNRIKVLRVKRRWTIDRIAARLRVSPSTVARCLKRLGLNRLSRLEPAVPVIRYERKQPGSLIHMDTKKLGRFNRPGHRVTGDRRQRTRRIHWEFVHVCIDDNSRIGYVEVLPDERQHTVVAFFKRACDYYAGLGIQVQGLMTDNGSAYRSSLLGQFLEARNIEHTFTRPYTPRTNGKAERFIQTLIREWAYAHRYPTSHQRTKALWPWLHDYNWHRPHGSLNKLPPISRLALSGDNLLTHHS